MNFFGYRGIFEGRFRVRVMVIIVGSVVAWLLDIIFMFYIYFSLIFLGFGGVSAFSFFGRVDFRAFSFCFFVVCVERVSLVGCCFRWWRGSRGERIFRGVCVCRGGG